MIEQLKEKRVVQWLLAYMAGAFVALQLMDALESPLGLTPRVQQSVVALLAVGLVVTVILSWSHGEKGRQSWTAAQGLALAVTSAAGLAVVMLVWNRGGDQATVESPPSAEAGPGEAAAGGDAGEVVEMDGAGDSSGAVAAGDTAVVVEGGDPASGSDAVAGSADAAGSDAPQPGAPTEAPDRASAPPPSAQLPAAPPGQEAPASARTLLPADPDVAVGDSVRLTLDPAVPAQWASSDPSVAMVTSDGLVLAVGPGRAEISASTGSVQARTSVIVRAAAPRSVTLEAIGPLDAGSQVQARARVVFEDGATRDDADLSWSSSDPGVAQVSSDGVITGVAPGQATIRAQIGAASGTAAVVVAAPQREEATAPAPPDAVLLAALERYRTALESRDIAQVESAYPTLSGDQRRGWEGLFGLGALRVEFGSIEIRRADAVSAELQFEQVLTGDRIERNATVFVAELRPVGDRWTIQTLREDRGGEP